MGILKIKNSAFLLLVNTVVVWAIASTGVADLLSLYTFDGTTDNAVGGAPNGSPVGSPAYVRGAIGQAIRLDGSSQYVDTTTQGFPNANVYGETSKGLWTGSTAFWINTTATKGSPLLCGANDGGNTFVNVYLNDGPVGVLSVSIRAEGNSFNLSIAAAPTVDWRDGAWHHVIMAWNQTTGAAGTGDFHIYVDGAAQTVTLPVHKLTSSDTFVAWEFPVRIGAVGRSTPVEFLAGLVDDVGIWNTVLSDTQAKALHRLGLDSVLNYNAKDAQALFEIFAAGPGSAGDTGDGKTWSYVSGLSGNPGDVVNGHTALVLDANGNGVSSAAASKPTR